MLQELDTKGYVICSPSYKGQKYSTLKKYFPTICKIKMCNKSILFFEDKADVAARAFLANMNKKIMSYQELKQVTKVFGVDLSIQEKNAFLGKTNHSIRRKRRRRKTINKQVFKEKQSQINDFLGRILHSEVLGRSKKKQHSYLL